MTTQQMEWGPEIKVDGKRPEWLKACDATLVRWNSAKGALSVEGAWNPSLLDRETQKGNRGWSSVYAVRLPADHPHYAQPDHVRDTPKMVFTPSPELTARMVNLVDLVADGLLRHDLIREEAQAIKAELEPVDPDLAFARQLFDVAYPDGVIAWDVPEVRDGWLRAAKHVRALAEAGK